VTFASQECPDWTCGITFNGYEGVGSGHNMKLTTRLRLLPRSRSSGAITPLLPYAFMVQTENFILPFLCTTLELSCLFVLSYVDLTKNVLTFVNVFSVIHPNADLFLHPD